MKKIVALTLLLTMTSLFLRAQQFSTQFELKENDNFGFNPLDVSFEHKAFPINSADGEHVLLLLSTAGTLRAEYLNKRLKSEKSIAASIPEVKELNVLLGGFQLDSTNYVAVYSNKKRNSFSAFQIKMDQDTVMATDFSLRFKNERILHTFTTEQGYYIVTIKSKSSTVKTYKLFRSLGGTLSMSRYAYTFSDEKQDRTLSNLYKELMEFTEKGNQRLTKVDTNHEATLPTAGSYFKLYQSSDKLILTLDHIHGRTSIYEMILSSTIKSLRIIDYPRYITNNPYVYNSNSWLKGDTLIQMAVSKEELIVLYHDWQAEEVIREFSFSKSSLDSAAYGHVFKGNKMGGNNAKKMKRLLKEIRKGQCAFTIRKDGPENLLLQVGTYRYGYEGPLAEVGQTQAALNYVQTEINQPSAFYVGVDLEDRPVQVSLPVDSVYVPIEDFKKE
ncbi:MAG: hypothetical protein AAFO69_19490, partial [Bacteroidota bacterium]